MMAGADSNGGIESRAHHSDNTLAGISFTRASFGNLSYIEDANKNKTAEATTGTMRGDGVTIPSIGYIREDRVVSHQRISGTFNES